MRQRYVAAEGGRCQQVGLLGGGSKLLSVPPSRNAWVLPSSNLFSWVVWPATWQEVALLVGPSARPQHLKLVLYANGSSRSAAGNSEQGGSDNPCSGSVTGGEYVAAGSLGLDTLLEAGGCGSGRQQFRVPMVDEVRPCEEAARGWG